MLEDGAAQHVVELVVLEREVFAHANDVGAGTRVDLGVDDADEAGRAQAGTDIEAEPVRVAADLGHEGAAIFVGGDGERFGDGELGDQVGGEEVGRIAEPAIGVRGSAEAQPGELGLSHGRERSRVAVGRDLERCHRAARRRTARRVRRMRIVAVRVPRQFPATFERPATRRP